MFPNANDREDFFFFPKVCLTQVCSGGKVTQINDISSDWQNSFLGKVSGCLRWEGQNSRSTDKFGVDLEFPCMTGQSADFCHLCGKQCGISHHSSTDDIFVPQVCLGGMDSVPRHKSVHQKAPRECSELAIHSEQGTAHMPV